MTAKPNFELLIETDRHAMRIYMLFSIVIVTSGLAIICYGVLFGRELQADMYKAILSIGGGFVSSLSGFSLKEYLARRDHIRGVQMVREMWHALTESPNTPESDLKRLEEIDWKIYEKGAVG